MLLAVVAQCFVSAARRGLPGLLGKKVVALRHSMVARIAPSPCRPTSGCGLTPLPTFQVGLPAKVTLRLTERLHLGLGSIRPLLSIPRWAGDPPCLAAGRSLRPSFGGVPVRVNLHPSHGGGYPRG